MRKAKYIIISEQIEEAIAKGVYQERLPGLNKLAASYQTTHITISKALRLLEKKGKVTVNGTRGTFISGEKQRPRFRVIGVIGLSSGKSGWELKTIQDIASKENYRVVALSDNSDLDRLLREDTDFLVNFPVDGFIFAYSAITENIATTLRMAGIPFVAMNYIPNISGINWAGFNSEDGFKCVLDEFATLGHRQIAFLGLKNLHYNYSKRMYKVYKDFMTDMGAFDNKFYYCSNMKEHHFEYEDDLYQNFAQEIVEYVMALKTRPTAIFIPLHIVAVKACKLFKKAGVKIPDDISIAGESDLRNKYKVSGIIYDYTLRAAEVTKIITGLLKKPDTPLTQKVLKIQWHSGNTMGPVSHLS
jgi:DNA-binding LacI/PurR family transcriptional regulator